MAQFTTEGWRNRVIELGVNQMRKRGLSDTAGNPYIWARIHGQRVPGFMPVVPGMQRSPESAWNEDQIFATIRVSGFVYFWGTGECSRMTFCQTLTHLDKLHDVVHKINQAVAGVDPHGYTDLRFTPRGSHRSRPPAYLLAKARDAEQMSGFIRLFNSLDFRTAMGEPLTAFVHDGPF